MSKAHLHALVELPANYTEIKAIVGKCKQKASHAIRDVIPGSVWSAGGEFKEVRNLGHFRNTYDYIRIRQERGAVVWSHRAEENWLDDPAVGIVVMSFGRKRIRAFAKAQTPASER